LFDKQQLEWVVRNHRVRAPEASIAAVAETLLGKVAVRNATPTASVAREVDRVVDDEFRKHCSVGPIRDGGLTVFVNDEGLIGPYRLRWAFPILDALQTSRRSGGVRSIRFVKAETRQAVGRGRGNASGPSVR
jgi:hypothetical protein